MKYFNEAMELLAFANKFLDKISEDTEYHKEEFDIHSDIVHIAERLGKIK